MIANSRARRIAALNVTAAALFCAATAVAQDTPANPLAAAENGVSLAESGAFEGYSLLAPMNSTNTYLIDMQGRIVHEWQSDYTPALSAYLLENGHLLRPAANQRGGGRGFGPGAGGDPGARRPETAERLQAAYQVLGVAPTASNAEVTRAYRRLMSRNHPDKLVANGLPESMVAAAHERTQRILEAYELIKQHRGMR